MIKDILNGIKSYTKAFAIISKLKLWQYFIIPISISLLTAIVICFLTYSFSDNIGDYISGLWPWEFGKETFSYISIIISILAILSIGLILYKHTVIALSAPFMSVISEKIESHIYHTNTTSNTTPFHNQLIRGIRVSGRNLLRELTFSLLILLISLIPIIGIFSTVLLLLVQAYYAGFGNIDYTLERHLSYKESIVFVRKNRGMAIGNGIPFIFILLIPILGVLLVFPLSVTAATLTTCDKIYLKK